MNLCILTRVLNFAMVAFIPLSISVKFVIANCNVSFCPNGTLLKSSVKLSSY